MANHSNFTERRRREHRILRRIRRRTQPGEPAGTLRSDPEAALPQVEVIRYNAETVERFPVKTADEIVALVDPRFVTWVNVDGLGDVELVRRIGESFAIHPLVLEDIVNVYQRPKVEQYGESLFIVVRAPLGTGERETEQIGVFLSKNLLITFQERPGGDPFSGVRRQLESARSRIRERRADYLAYSLIDTVIDCYYPQLERLSGQLESAEERTLKQDFRDLPPQLQLLKEEFIHVKRALWPLRDAMNSLARDSGNLIDAETRIYFRDCYDHAMQLLELVETHRELCIDLTNLYLSSVSNRLNEIMKFLTIISTIFIPLNFVVGIYGMNFNTETSPWNMPELNWYWGYPLVLCAMLALGLGLVTYFHRRGWIG